jgi:hypothetical protein
MNALSMIQRCGTAQSGHRSIKGIGALATMLERLLEEGGDHNFIILHADEAKNYFVQFAGSRGEAIVRGEAVSNLYLEPAHMLDPKRSKALRALGWNPPTPGQSPNFYRDWDARDTRTRRQMARLALRTLVEIYGLEPSARVGCKLFLDDPATASREPHDGHQGP